MEVKLKLTNEEHKELVAFCNLNDLLISSVVKDSFTTGFNIERYGLLNFNQDKEKIIEKEIFVEKRVEVPIEVIKEIVKVEYVEVEKPIEIIKEIPLEKIVIQEVIREVPVEKVVEKIVNIRDDSQIDELVGKTEKLKTENEIFSTKIEELEGQIQIFSTKTSEMENIFQNEKNELLSKIQQLENKEPVVHEDSGCKDKLFAIQNTVQKIRSENIDKDKKIKELEGLIVELQSFNKESKAVFLNGSNLNKTL